MRRTVNRPGQEVARQSTTRVPLRAAASARCATRLPPDRAGLGLRTATSSRSPLRGSVSTMRPSGPRPPKALMAQPPFSGKVNRSSSPPIAPGQLTMSFGSRVGRPDPGEWCVAGVTQQISEPYQRLVRIQGDLPLKFVGKHDAPSGACERRTLAALVD